MSEVLHTEGDLTPTKEQEERDLSSEQLEKVAGGRPIWPVRPALDSDESTPDQCRERPPRY